MPLSWHEQTLTPRELAPVSIQVPSPETESLSVLPSNPKLAEGSTAILAKID